MINRYHLQREFQMVSENKSVKREWNFKKKKVCEMHLGGRKVGGCNCVFMRMRYSRPAQSVPFVSLHYCTIHCIHTLQTAHCTSSIAILQCWVRLSSLCPTITEYMHALQIADCTDVEQIQSTLPFSQFKRTGHHSVQHNSDICTEVFCPV